MKATFQIPEYQPIGDEVIEIPPMPCLMSEMPVEARHAILATGTQPQQWVTRAELEEMGYKSEGVPE